MKELLRLAHEGVKFGDLDQDEQMRMCAAVISLSESVLYLWNAWSEAEGNGQPEDWVFGPGPDMRAYYTDNDVKPSHDPSKFSEWHEAPAVVQAVIAGLLGKLLSER